MGNQRKKPGLTIEIQVWDRHDRRLRARKFEGKVYSIDGVHLKLFPLRVLCAAIDRIPRTVADWERQEKFPKPMYVLPNRKYQRWYSEHQILALNQIWLKYRHHGKNQHLPLDKFLHEIWDVFYRIDAQKIKEKEDDNRVDNSPQAVGEDH